MTLLLTEKNERIACVVCVLLQIIRVIGILRHRHCFTLCKAQIDFYFIASLFKPVPWTLPRRTGKVQSLISTRNSLTKRNRQIEPSLRLGRTLSPFSRRTYLRKVQNNQIAPD